MTAAAGEEGGVVLKNRANGGLDLLDLTIDEAELIEQPLLGVHDRVPPPVADRGDRRPAPAYADRSVSLAAMESVDGGAGAGGPGGGSFGA